MGLHSSKDALREDLLAFPTSRQDSLQLAGAVLLEVLNLGVVSLNLLIKLDSVGCALACELGLVCLV